jgi:hypothetical protein
MMGRKLFHALLRQTKGRALSCIRICNTHNWILSDAIRVKIGLYIDETVNAIVPKSLTKVGCWLVLIGGRMCFVGEALPLSLIGILFDSCVAKNSAEGKENRN